MQLEGLEDQLLQRLADAPADILADVGLIEVGAVVRAFSKYIPMDSSSRDMAVYRGLRC